MSSASLALLALSLLVAGCGTLNQQSEPGSRSLGSRVELVRKPLDAASRRSLERAQEALAREQPAKARALLKPLSEAYAYAPEVLLALATLERREGRRERAISYYQRLLRVEPQHPSAANDLALLYRGAGRIEEASGLLSRAVEKNPDRPRLHYNLAVLYELYLMDLDRALEHYRRYQALTEKDHEEVGRWIQDLERRVE